METEMNEVLDKMKLRKLENEMPDQDEMLKELMPRFECGKDFEYSVTLPLQTSFMQDDEELEDVVEEKNEAAAQ